MLKKIKSEQYHRSSQLSALYRQRELKSKIKKQEEQEIVKKCNEDIQKEKEGKKLKK